MKETYQNLHPDLPVGFLATKQHGIPIVKFWKSELVYIAFCQRNTKLDRVLHSERYGLEMKHATIHVRFVEKHCLRNTLVVGGTFAILKDRVRVDQVTTHSRVSTPYAFGTRALGGITTWRDLRIRILSMGRVPRRSNRPMLRWKESVNNH